MQLFDGGGFAHIVHMRVRATICATLAMAGCASLGPLARIVQPPTFEQAPGRSAEVRLLSPSFSDPLGGAHVRLWMNVGNPNPFGFALSTLHTTLFLEGSRAAIGDFPLGLPLGAHQQSVMPIDLTVSFSDVPGLASALVPRSHGAAARLPARWHVGVDAGRFGTPTFGPMLLMEGEFGVSVR